MVSVKRIDCDNSPKWMTRTGVTVDLIDTSTRVQTFGPWQKALVVLVLAMNSMEIRPTITNSLFVTFQPTDSLVAANTVVTPFQSRFAIFSGKTFSFTITIYSI